MPTTLQYHTISHVGRPDSERALEPLFVQVFDEADPQAPPMRCKVQFGPNGVWLIIRHPSGADGATVTMDYFGGKVEVQVWEDDHGNDPNFTLSVDWARTEREKKTDEGLLIPFSWPVPLQHEAKPARLNPS